eukprot:128339-Rhodomonas_salina.4
MWGYKLQNCVRFDGSEVPTGRSQGFGSLGRGESSTWLGGLASGQVHPPRLFEFAAGEHPTLPVVGCRFVSCASKLSRGTDEVLSRIFRILKGLFPDNIEVFNDGPGYDAGPEDEMHRPPVRDPGDTTEGKMRLYDALRSVIVELQVGAASAAATEPEIKPSALQRTVLTTMSQPGGALAGQLPGGQIIRQTFGAYPIALAEIPGKGLGMVAV